jgi:hypothetical protein
MASPATGRHPDTGKALQFHGFPVETLNLSTCFVVLFLAFEKSQGLECRGVIWVDDPQTIGRLQDMAEISSWINF